MDLKKAVYEMWKEDIVEGRTKKVVWWTKVMYNFVQIMERY